MRTLAPEARPDLWSTRVGFEDLDSGAAPERSGGLVVHVPTFDASRLDDLIGVLDDPLLDGVEFGRPIGRADACAAIAVLRECQSRDVDVAIEFDDDLASDAEAWAHLARATSGVRRLDLYRRHGPGFIQVVDDRPNHHVRIVFDDPADVDLMIRLERPTSVADVDAARLRVLADFDLVAVVDDAVVLTVARIRAWPVPIHDLFDPPTA